MRLLAATAALFIAILSAVPASASPEDIFGYGTRSPAMGGTGVAHSDGFEAAYTNPALLSRIRDLKLTLGFAAATFNLHADGAGLPGEVPYDSMREIIIGVDVPLPLGGVLKNRIGTALALSTPTNVVVRGDIPYPEQAQFPLLPDRAQSVSVRAGIGIDFGWGIRLGAGFAALAELDGSAVVATDATGRVTSNVQEQLVATYAPTFGLSFDVPLKDHETTRIGASYRGALAANFDVAIDATKLSSLNLPVLTIAGLAQYDPEQVSFEIARSQGPFLFAAGVTYKWWSQYPGILEATVPCPASDPSCGSLTPPSITYSNTIVPRVGVEYTLRAQRSLSVHVRAGAFYEPSPLPSKLPSSQAFDPVSQQAIAVPTRYFDADRLAITLGYGVTLRNPLPPITLDLFGQAHVLMPRTIESDASNASLPGVASVDSIGKVSGTVFAAGLLAGVAF
ncbi:MAG: OmpP1/FadL family transporter [Polyangiaceae bacterium]